jgi:hypothetical protein
MGALVVCAQVVVLQQGKLFISYTIKTRFEPYVFVAIDFVDMYAKYSRIEFACQVLFEKFLREMWLHGMQ